RPPVGWSKRTSKARTRSTPILRSLRRRWAGRPKSSSCRRSEMTRAGLVALVAIALWSSALAAPGEKTIDAKAEILRLDAEWAKAAEARDLERILSYWS